MPRLSNLSCPKRYFILVALVCVLCTAVGVRGESTPRDASSGLAIGIDGHYRVGCWTGIRVESKFTSLETRDGDGVQVRYGKSAGKTDAADRQGSDQHWGYVVPGSEAAPLVVHDDQHVVISTRFPTAGSPSRGPAMIPLSMPWILVFGDTLGVDQIGVNRLLGRDSLVAVSQPTTAQRLPDSVLGLDGIDVMIIGGDGKKVLATLSEAQQQAIVQWVTDGGRVLLTLGESCEELMRAAPWLQKLVPIEQVTTVTINPATLETYTSTQTPLQPFVGAKLPKDEGHVLIMGRTSRRISTPVAAEYNVGFGKVTVVAADLDDDLFAQWPERLDLIKQLTGSMIVPERRDRELKHRTTAYNDLAGQLRATLDRFHVQKPFRFSVISLLLMALIAAIGPLDYLLVNRLLGRPLLGWLSFPVMAIGLSILLVSQARIIETDQSAASSSIRCNRLEIIDIDAVDQIGRGYSVNYLYTHDASRFNVDVRSTDAFESVTAKIEQSLISPFGYPGESFGGIQIAIEDARLPVYRVPFERDESSLKTSLVGLPLAPRSSKGFSNQVRFEPKFSSMVQLQRRPGSELLQGELINPLPVDLLDGMLVFRNWVYLLPTRFPANGRIGAVDSLRQKPFRWLLSRQKALESSSENEAWDPAANNSPNRVAEMLMFHEAVGGTQYTRLDHNPLERLDLSHVLADDRCLLVGRVGTEMTQLVVNQNDTSFSPTGEKLTMLRVVLPVKTTSRR